MRLLERQPESAVQQGRTDLKIFFRGLLLNGPDDPAIQSLSNCYDKRTFAYLAENPSKLTGEISFARWIDYSTIKSVTLRLFGSVQLCTMRTRRFIAGTE